MKSIFIGIILLVASSANAASQTQIQVYARAFHNSCSYYTNTKADFDVTLQDTSLPWGTKVTLISGLGEQGRSGAHDAHWQEYSEQEMSAISSYTWRARRSATLAERSSPKNYTSLEFVIKIEEPGKDPRYINFYNDDGYYSATILRSTIRCVSSASEQPKFDRLRVVGVRVN